MAIQAIPTEYKGYKFRSRLEARWAVFFDSIGIEWSYEHEGYDLDGEWYLPDFWISSWNCFAEIKPTKPKLFGRGYSSENVREYRLCQKLAENSKHVVLLIGGNPWIEWDEEEYSARSEYDVAVFAHDPIEKTDCKIPVRYSAFATRVSLEFFSSDSNLYGLMKERMPAPTPARGDAHALIELDKKYQIQKRGRHDDRWQYGIADPGFVFIDDGEANVVLVEPYQFRPNEIISLYGHYRKARQFNPS